MIGMTAKSLPMEAEQKILAQENHDSSVGTLGDVLYGRNSAAPEEDWVGLVHSIAAGDQLALHALYERTHRVVFTLIMRISNNQETAEELTLDVFHDVWRRRASSYDATNGTVLGWIMNQARSRAIDRLRFEQRKKRVIPQAGEAPPPLETVDCDAVLERERQGSVLRGALAMLTPAERQVIEVTFFSELTHAETATRLNLPLGTVKTRIRSALHKLRHALTGGAEEP